MWKHVCNYHVCMFMSLGSKYHVRRMYVPTLEYVRWFCHWLTIHITILQHLQNSKRSGHSWLKRPPTFCTARYYSIYICRYKCRLSCFLLLVGRRVPVLILPRAFRRLWLRPTHSLNEVRLRPHPNLAFPGLLFRTTILLFNVAEFSTSLGFVHGCQPHLQHLQPHVLPEEPPAVIHLCHHPIILVASV